MEQQQQQKPKEWQMQVSRSPSDALGPLLAAYLHSDQMAQQGKSTHCVSLMA